MLIVNNEEVIFLFCWLYNGGEMGLGLSVK